MSGPQTKTAVSPVVNATGFFLYPRAGWQSAELSFPDSQGLSKSITPQSMAVPSPRKMPPPPNQDIKKSSLLKLDC